MCLHAAHASSKALCARHSNCIACDPFLCCRLPQSECLNTHKDHGFRDCLEAGPREDSSKFLQSDCDEELLITIKFMQNVKISHIQIEGVDAERAPNKVSLFINPLNLDFDSAKSEKPTQMLELTEACLLYTSPSPRDS